MSKRPTLRPGDVCKLHRKAQHRYPRLINKSLLVLRTYGDPTDGMARIVVSYSPMSVPKTVPRRALWYTGYNSYVDQKSQTMPTTPSYTTPGKFDPVDQAVKEMGREIRKINQSQGPTNNDGRDNCYVCHQPTQSVAMGAYQVCKNIKCKWYDR